MTPARPNNPPAKDTTRAGFDERTLMTHPLEHNSSMPPSAFYAVPIGDTKIEPTPIYHTLSRPTLRALLASHLTVPDMSVYQARALMGEAPPKWSSEGDHEQSLVCMRWWAECEAKYRRLHTDSLLAELERTAK